MSDNSFDVVIATTGVAHGTRVARGGRVTNRGIA